jgi:hypothetical protein
MKEEISSFLFNTENQGNVYARNVKGETRAICFQSSSGTCFHKLGCSKHVFLF